MTHRNRDVDESSVSLLERVIMGGHPHMSVTVKAGRRTILRLLAVRQIDESMDAAQQRFVDLWQSDSRCTAVAALRIIQDGLSLTMRAGTPHSIVVSTVDHPSIAARRRARTASGFLAWIRRGCPGVVH